MQYLQALLAPVLCVVLLSGCRGGSGNSPIAAVPGTGGDAIQPQAPASLSSVVRTQAHPESCLTRTCIYTSGGIVVSGSTITPSLGVFRARANGKVAQIQEISGDKTDLNLPGVAVDARRNIYATGGGYYGTRGGTVAVYAHGANGNVRPLHTISGPKTGLDAHGIAVDTRGKIYVVNSTSVTEYAAGSDGNVKPSITITGPRTGIASPTGIAVDAERRIYVINGGTPAVTVYAPDAHGNVAPIQTISGTGTGLIDPSGIAVDTAGDIYVTTCTAPSHCLIGNSEGAVLVFASGAQGNIAPIRAIEGPSTGLAHPGGIALDASANVYVTEYYSNYNGPCIMAHAEIVVLMFSVDANGNAAPIQGFESANCSPAGIAVR